MVAFVSLEEMSCAWLIQCRLSDILHWYAQSHIFISSLLSVNAEVFIQFTMLNKVVSLVKSLTSGFSPCGRSFI